MSAMDFPHLRRKSITALADTVSSRFLGSRVNTDGRGLLAWFGLASFVSGSAFMVIGFQRLVPTFLQLGYPGHMVVLLVVSLFVVLAAKAVIRFFGLASRRRSPVWRRAGLLVIGTAIGAGLLMVIPVKSVVVAGYTYSDGELKIVVPIESSAQDIAPGDKVTLRSQGMVLHEELGQAIIGAEPSSNATAPIDSILPATFPGVTVPVRAYLGRLEGSLSLPASGRAEVTGQGTMRLGEWLWGAALNSPLWPEGLRQTINDFNKETP